MGLLDMASAVSAWRGYEYYKANKVLSWKQTDENNIDGIVAGSGGARYNVHLQLDHPRKSTCDCPHANGKRIVCKHKIALFFTVFPEEAETYYREVVAYEEEEERRQELLEQKIINYVDGLTKEELKEHLLQLLFDGPEWQYDHFLEEQLGVFSWDDLDEDEDLDNDFDEDEEDEWED